jgi:hypothetical protein
MMIRHMMLVGVIAICGSVGVEAGHGHPYRGYYGPRFGVFVAPPPPPVIVAAPVVVAPPVVAPAPVYPAYPYPVYVPPVYAPVGLGVQTRNFSLFFGR